MPYATDRDRNPHNLEIRDPEYPVPPLNLFLTSGQEPGCFDLCWDDPSHMAANGMFTLLGVNIYRSFDSEYGPYERLTELPLGARYYKDRTDNALVVDELVEDAQWVMRGECTGAEALGVRYAFRTLRPIVVPASQALPESNTNAVVVTVDGVPAKVKRVLGATGEVELETSEFPNVATQRLDASPIPTDSSVVKVTYRYNRSLLKTDLSTRIFYRVTSVGTPVNANPSITTPSQIRETPLARASVTNSREVEKIDWIWKEGVRRNRWIIQQGGERVKVFLQKTVGETCSCYQASTHKQPLNDCTDCYGVGILRGYEGPYEITIAPDDAERRIDQGNRGRHVEHTYDVWTTPSPLLSQRDFVVKINGERFSIGPVRMPSNRGMVLQQHFNIGFIDEKDIRYKVPMDGVQSIYQVEGTPPPQLAAANPTSKGNIPDERELKGRTKTWENTSY